MLAAAQSRSHLFCEQHGKKQLHALVAHERKFHENLQKLGNETSIRTSKLALSRIVYYFRKYHTGTSIFNVTFSNSHTTRKQATERRTPCSSTPFSDDTLVLKSNMGIASDDLDHILITGFISSGLASPAIHIAEPILDLRPVPAASTSRGRLTSNSKSLAVDLSFNFSPYGALNGTATPITPLDKILHTPACPPSLQRSYVRDDDALAAVKTPENTATSPPQSQYLISSKALCRVSDNVRRRLSVVAPPEAMPMHAPRRLSYSHTYGKPRSPLARRIAPNSSDVLASCAETDLLASPLVILPSSTFKQSIDWTDGGGYMSDFHFPSVASPRGVKV